LIVENQLLNKKLQEKIKKLKVNKEVVKNLCEKKNGVLSDPNSEK